MSPVCLRLEKLRCGWVPAGVLADTVPSSALRAPSPGGRREWVVRCGLDVSRTHGAMLKPLSRRERGWGEGAAAACGAAAVRLQLVLPEARALQPLHPPCRLQSKELPGDQTARAPSQRSAGSNGGHINAQHPLTSSRASPRPRPPTDDVRGRLGGPAPHRLRRRPPSYSTLMVWVRVWLAPGASSITSGPALAASRQT